MKFDIKKIIPYLLTFLAIYAAVFIYCKPEILDRKKINQHDGVQFEAMITPLKAYHDRGERAYWSPNLFSGMPNYTLYGNVEGAPIFSYLGKITYGFFNGDTHVASYMLFASIFCFWVLLLSFGVRNWLAFAGALCFGFGTHTVILIDVGHFTKVMAIAYGAMVIGGLRLVFNGKYFLGFTVSLFALALQVSSSHYQITFYLIFPCLAYAISELIFAIKENRIKTFTKSFAILTVVVVLAAFTFIGAVIVINNYSKYSMRGEQQLSALPNEAPKPKEGLDKDYAFEWSEGKMETLTFLVPYFYGGASSEKINSGMETYAVIESLVGKERMKQLQKQIRIPLYHGEQRFTAGSIYVGAVVCFLFLLGMLVLEDRLRWWILAGVTMSFMLAWGKNLAFFNYFLFDYLPGFNKFRSVSMALSIALILMPLTAFVTLNKLITEKLTAQLQKQIYIALVGTAGLALLIFVSTSFTDYSTPNDTQVVQSMFGADNPTVVSRVVAAIQNDRASLARSDAFRSAVLIGLVGLLLIFALKDKINRNYALIAICVLSVGDLFFVAKRYLNYDNFDAEKSKSQVMPTPADRAILTDNSLHYRVFNLSNPFNEAMTSAFHKSAGGYSPVKLMRYQDLIERGLTPQIQQFIDDARSGAMKFENYHLFNMLNIKYFKYNEEANGVISNPTPNGAAWFVSKVNKANNPDEEMANLLSINTKTTAVVDVSRFPITKTDYEIDSSATIQLTEYDPHHANYIVNTSKESFIVFSEVYYPEWKVTINGKEANMLTANYLLRGLVVPAGKSEIKFEFVPALYQKWRSITTIAQWLTFICIIVGIGLSIKNKETA